MTVPNSGPMKTAARFWVPSPSTYVPSPHTRRPGQGVSAVKVMRSSRCACCTPAVRKFSRISCGKLCLAEVSDGSAMGSISSSFSSTPSTRCGDRLSTVNGPATRTFLLSWYGLSYRYSYSARAAMEASISLCRPMRAFHQSPCSVRTVSLQPGCASRGISHSCHSVLSAVLSCWRSGSSVACHLSQMTSISALFAIDFSVMCGTRS
jgi:hypothetical protein